MKSPCLSCERLHEDKNTGDCLYCRKRIRYVREIGGFPDSKEITMTENTNTQPAPESSTPVEVPRLSAPEDAPLPGSEKVQAAPTKPKRTCKVPGCNLPHLARGYCSKHYAKLYKKKKPKKASTRKPAPSTAKTGKAAKTLVPLTMNFGSIPGASGVLEKVATISEQKFRPLEYQVIKLLSEATTARGGA